jgi:hypothetical protein
MSLLDQSVTAKIQRGVLPKSITGLGSGEEGAGIVRYATWSSAPRTPRSRWRSSPGAQACFNLWRDDVARLRAQES